MSLSPLQYAAMKGKVDVCKALYKGGELDREEIIKAICPISKKEIDKSTDIKELRRDTDGNILFVDAIIEMISKLDVGERTKAKEGIQPLPVKLDAIEYAVLHGHEKVVRWFMGFEYCKERTGKLMHMAAGLKNDHMVSVLQKPTEDEDWVIILPKFQSLYWERNQTSAEDVISMISDLVATLSCESLCKFMGELHAQNMNPALVVCASKISEEMVRHSGIYREWMYAINARGQFMQEAEAQKDAISVEVMQKCMQ